MISIHYNGLIRDYQTPEEAITFLETLRVKKLAVTFYYIGGWEMMRDGTQKDGPFFNIEEVYRYLESYECDIPPFELIDTSVDFKKFVEDIEPIWQNRWNDGGGSAWIEIKEV